MVVPTAGAGEGRQSGAEGTKGKGNKKFEPRVRGENFSWKNFLMEIREISHTPESPFMGKYGKFSHIIRQLN